MKKTAELGGANDLKYSIGQVWHTLCCNGQMREFFKLGLLGYCKENKRETEYTRSCCEQKFPVFSAGRESVRSLSSLGILIARNQNIDSRPWQVPRMRYKVREFLEGARQIHPQFDTKSCAFFRV